MTAAIKVPKILGIHHSAYLCRDAKQTRDFYCDVLGCVIEKEMSPELGLAQLRAGDALIDIVTVDGKIGRTGGAGPGKEGRNMDHFCVRVEPFDANEIRKHRDLHRVMTSGAVETRYGAEGDGPSIYLPGSGGQHSRAERAARQIGWPL